MSTTLYHYIRVFLLQYITILPLNSKYVIWFISIYNPKWSNDTFGFQNRIIRLVGRSVPISVHLSEQSVQTYSADHCFALFYYMLLQVFSASSWITFHANSTSPGWVLDAHTANLRKNVSLTLAGTRCIRLSALIVFSSLSLTSFEPYNVQILYTCTVYRIVYTCTIWYTIRIKGNIRREIYVCWLLVLPKVRNTL